MRVAPVALLLLACGTANAAEDELLAVAPQQLPKAWELQRRAWE